MAALAPLVFLITFLNIFWERGVLVALYYAFITSSKVGLVGLVIYIVTIMGVGSRL